MQFLHESKIRVRPVHGSRPRCNRQAVNRYNLFQLHEQSTHSQDALGPGKVGCQNWHAIACTYSAEGGEHDRQQDKTPYAEKTDVLS